jgi:hypothetical protein
MEWRGEFRSTLPRLVQTFQNHLQTLEFEDLGDRRRQPQTMHFRHAEGATRRCCPYI